MACAGSMFSAFSQKYSATDSLYLTALEKYVEEFYPTYLRPTHQGKKQLFIESSTFFHPFPDSVKGYQVVTLNGNNMRQVYQENHDTLYHISISPVSISSDTLMILIRPYHGTYRKKKLRLGMSDWMEVHFIFDCIQKRYVYLKSEKRGF